MKVNKYVPVLILMTLLSCSSQKKLVAEAPFDLGGSSVQKWIGGVSGSGTGYTVKIPVTQKKIDNVVMQQLYFRGKLVDLQMQTEDNNTYAIAKFTNGKEKNLDNVPVAGSNTAAKDALGFELNADEAVIVYSENNKTKYYKISGIKEKEPLIYRGRPKTN